MAKEKCRELAKTSPVADKTDWSKKGTGRSVGRPSWLLGKVVGPDGELVPVVDAMCARIRLGVSLRGACEAFGIAYASFFESQAAGIRDLDAGRVTKYSQFTEQIARARAECRSRHVTVIDSSDDWRAHAWLLERQFYAEYGERKQVDVQGTSAPQILIQLPAWASAVGVERQTQAPTQLPSCGNGERAELPSSGDPIRHENERGVK